MKLRDLKRRNRRRRSLHFSAYWVGPDNRRGETKTLRLTYRGDGGYLRPIFTFNAPPPAGTKVHVIAHYSPQPQPLGAPHALATS